MCTISFLLAGLLIPIVLSGQMQVTSGVFSPKDLIENVFLANGVEVISVQFDGSTQSIGYFNNAENNIGIKQGIIMSTGFAGTAANPNNSGSTTGSISPGATPDNDLQSLDSTITTLYDKSVFEIIFIPYADTLEFKYVFASEEYQEYVCTQFNDVFGFFISGNGFSGPFNDNAENIALVPGTSTYVAINTVNNGNPNMGPGTCPPQNPQYFNLTAANGQPTFDGYTDVFIARAIVVPCDTYKIRLALADVGDSAFDSGVFLEAKSFGTPSVDFALQTVASNETIAEGCSNGLGTFKIRANSANDLLIPLTFTGTATYGDDYTMDPPVVIIPAGSSETTVTFTVFSDGILEGTESIGLVFQRTPCEIDTLWFYITDDTLVKPNLGLDQMVCEGDPVALDGTVNMELPQPKMFENPNNYPLISPQDVTTPLIPVYSPVQVSGVFPRNLGPGMIESVCMNIQHLWIDDVDVYLVAPSGRFIALTTDNGRDGDHYTETCFSPKATQPIDFGDPFGAPKFAAPFTGMFQPEGEWHELWDASENPVNGTWNLLVLDDAPLPDGMLLNWRITFNPEYALHYVWSPGTEVACDTCSATSAIGDTSKTLILQLRDSYGCVRSDTVDIGLLPQVDVPIPLCSKIGYNDLEVAWGDQGLGENYEISINGGPWITPSAGFAHFVGGLGLSDSVTFELRVLGPCNIHTVTVGCRTLDCIPPQVSLATSSHPLCTGQSNGSISLDVIPGPVPYTIQLNGNTIASTNLTGLPAGVYLFEVIDTLGCKNVLQITLDDPLPLMAVPSIDTVKCFQASTGSAVANAQGGSGTLTYLWNTGAMTPTIQSVPSGNYTLTITDDNGCTLVQSLFIPQYSALDATSVIINPTCPAPNGGKISVSPFGGAGAYTFNWSQSGMNGNAPDNLPSGSYTLTLTDYYGCSTVLQYSLSAPSNIVPDSVVARPTSCFGGSDGSIAIYVSGGIPPYNYFWSDGGPNVSVRNNLPAGDYTITVTDQDTCVIEIMATVFSPTEIMVTPVITAVTCNGQSNGSITVSVTGGAGGYVIAWSNGVMGTVNNNLTSGNYNYTVTDALGCTVSGTVFVPEPQPITTIGTGKDATCYNLNNGLASIGASGGNGGYTYLWNDPSGSTMSTVPDLFAGTYRVTVTDALGCTAIDSVTVGQPPLFSSVVFPTQVKCFGQQDGAATVTPLGGSAPYSYLWSDPASQNGPFAQNLSAGTWFVTITDKNNCIRIDSVVLMDPPQLIINATSQNITCFGANDGRGMVTVTGGTTPYSFDWSSGSKQAQANNLTPGSHNVTVTDDNGCIQITSVTIQQAPEIVISGTATGVSCQGDNSGSIDITVIGGAPPYSYQWNHGDTVEDPQNLGPGIYVVSVTDDFNCTRTFNIQIVSPPGMSGGIEKIDVACFGGQTGSATVVVTGGSPSYSYVWNNGANTPVIDSLAPGIYSVTVTDQNNCTIIESIEITQPVEPLSAVLTTDTLDCFGDRNGRIEFSVIGGTPAYRYSVNGQTFNGSNVQIGLPAGTYGGWITDKNGCSFYAGEITIHQPPQIIIDLGPELFIELGEQVQLIANVTNGIPPLTYQWYIQDSAFLSCLTCPDPFVNGLQFTRAFRVQVTDANGCTEEAIINVNVAKERVVLVPTAFTPNNDNQNERMGVLGKPGTIIRGFEIFDRWGEKVFQADEFRIEDGGLPQNSWDGTFKGKPMNSGVYVWHLYAEYTDGEKGIFKGQTTLLR